ncbi:unnamed protein product [Cochlearia groenlandica]
METKAEIKEQQWKDSTSQSLSSSSSRCSSITSNSSAEGHFDIRHFPLPKPTTLSASEAHKQRETHQACNLPVYDPNRIPSSVFSNKPANSAEWSIASNESLFSIHDGTFCIPTKEDHGLAKEEQEPVHEITEINPVKIPTEPGKETITENKQNRDEIGGEEEIIELEREDKHNEEEEEEEEEEDMMETEVLAEIETGKVVEEDVKENKQEDTISIVSHSPTASCRSDISNNSISSFAFPLLDKEDGIAKTPSMELRVIVPHKRRPEYLLPPSPIQPHQPQTQPYAESSTPSELEPKLQPQQKASNKLFSKTLSRKALKSGLFSCFHCPSKCCMSK